MGRPVQTRPKGPGQIRREAKRRLAGWRGHGTLRGCRRDGPDGGSENCAQDDQVGERSGGGEERGAVRAGAQGTYLVPCWAFSLVSDPKLSAPSLACPP